MTYTANEEMPAAEMKRLMQERGAAVEAFLAVYQKDLPGIPKRLAEAMLYSLQAGGKRIRPILCMTCAELCGIPWASVIPFAAGIEMIHTYSLIHDDLPAMDNDDLRRGKPSNHKAFDEATAILAGDGLLTDAFYIMSCLQLPPSAVLAAVHEFARSAGSSGMAGGQELDMIHTGKNDLDKEGLAHLNALKTGAILRASCVCGAILAEAGKDLQDRMSVYGMAIGKAFQIADDILDVVGDSKILGKPVGNDAEAGKNTWPSLLGLKESRRLALAESERAVAAIDGLAGADAAFLRALARYVVERVN